MLRLSMNVSREMLRTSNNIQKLMKCKFSRIAYNTTNISLRNNDLFNVHKHSRIPTIYVVRHQSTIDSTAKTTIANTQEAASAQQIQNTIGNANTTEADKSFISEIPDAPIPPSEEVTSVIAEVLTTTGEPTFTSLGLGGYGPIGILQYSLECLHISFGLPWWATIATTSVIIKLITLPFVIKSTKSNATMVIVMPKMMKIQDKLTEARRNGDREEAAYYTYELAKLRAENKISVATFGASICNVLLHLPMFLCLKGVASAPIESLKTGGLWWFKDLTVSDPYYMLPVLTFIGSFSLASHIVDTATIRASPMVQYIIKGAPFIGLAVALNLPAAVLCHWVISAFLTLIQHRILRLDKVKAFLNIPQPVESIIKHDSALKKKSFKEACSEAWTNLKISNKMMNHIRADEVQFNEAGKGAVKKTFKYNPVTKQPMKSFAAMKK